MRRAALSGALALLLHVAVGVSIVVAVGGAPRPPQARLAPRRIDIEFLPRRATPRPGAASQKRAGRRPAAPARRKATAAAPPAPRPRTAARHATRRPTPAAAKSTPSPAAAASAPISPRSASPRPAPLAAITAPVGITGDELGAPVAAAASPAPHRTARAALVRYAAIVRAHVARRQRYPRRARSLGLEGRVVLELKIKPSGELAAAPRLERRSGFPLLDREALRMARAAAPFPPPPGPAAVTVAIPVDFSLR